MVTHNSVWWAFPIIWSICVFSLPGPMVYAQEIKSNFNTDAIKPQLKDATGNYITRPFSQVNLHGVPKTDQVGSTLNSSGTLRKQPI